MLAAANPTLVKREVYGKSLLGTDLVAYKVTANASTTADGGKPGVMFHGAQHAREWISAEVVRRGFQYFLDHSARTPRRASRRCWRRPRRGSSRS